MLLLNLQMHASVACEEMPVLLNVHLWLLRHVTIIISFGVV